MAQKKLLCVLVSLLVFCPLHVSAAEIDKLEPVKMSEEDRAFGSSLFKQSLKLTLQNIKEKFLELIAMEETAKDLTNNLSEGVEVKDAYATNVSLVNATPLMSEAVNMPSFSEVSLKVFVSSSMSEELLKSYIAEAKKYKASLIFNGLINGSWKETQKFVMSLTKVGEEAVPILINDEEFREFSITSVPTIILIQEDGLNFNGGNDHTNKVFDKVTGNIGIRGALTLFAAEGELSEHASKLLEGDK